MSTSVAVVVVRCPQHGATMERRAAHTPEQAWCGAWWDAPLPKEQHV